MFQTWLQITLVSILLQKTASEVQRKKRCIFLIVHFGQRAKATLLLLVVILLL